MAMVRELVQQPDVFVMVFCQLTNGFRTLREVALRSLVFAIPITLGNCLYANDRNLISLR